MADILTLISDPTDWIFPRTCPLHARPYLGDRIFPDQKTENLKAEYLRWPTALHCP